MNESRGRREDGYWRHYADMHAAMRGHGTASTSAHDVGARAVEGGSRIVAVPRGGCCCVLQMPRGNLEAVSPRALVLAALAQALLVHNRTPLAAPHALLTLV
jgi:elongator complex protein 1